MIHRIKIIVITSTLLIMLIAAICIVIISNQTPEKQSSSNPEQTTQTVAIETNVPAEPYTGKSEIVANTFSVKIPNGWKASIADSGSFQAIMFARPEQLPSLIYNASAQPVVDRNGIPAWNGLTEHFYIRSVQASQAFDPGVHKEVSSQPYNFNDGTSGTLYNIVKHADEAKQYGGLLRDTEWQGRVYTYEKNGVRVEAHLALYPSSTIDKPLYESVVRSVTL